MSILNEDNILIMVVIAFGLSALIAFFMTPVSIWVAHRIGAIDVPKDDRRMHKKPIPRFGGLAIFAGTMVTMGLLEGDNELIRVAMLGGALMYLLGAIDDLKNLRAHIKFVGQTGIAILMYALGIRIAFIANYFGPGKLMLADGLSFVITVLWIVGITNAVNLMDGLDGLAAGIAAIVSTLLAYVAYIHGGDMGMLPVCISLMTIAGGCAGFLPYNFHPAKTFMGDSGALFIGYMIAIMSVISPLKRATFIAALVPIMALAVPIFDTLFAIVRRLARHEDIMAPDKGHIHHRIMATGFGQRRAVLVIYGIVGIMGMSAVLISRELYKDAVILMIIAVIYLSVILVPQKPRDYESPSDWIRKAKPKDGESEWQKDIED